MPNKQQGLLAFFILQETASILRMNVSVILFFMPERRERRITETNDSGNWHATKERRLYVSQKN